ncbi:hypothetical protein GQ457_06G002400 [Hibiscus cannabinus]
MDIPKLALQQSVESEASGRQPLPKLCTIKTSMVLKVTVFLLMFEKQVEIATACFVCKDNSFQTSLKGKHTRYTIQTMELTGSKKLYVAGEFFLFSMMLKIGDKLNFNESLQLFHWFAFGCNSMSESFMECAASLVKQCGGLPLALQVLGSSLSGKSMNVWRSALEKLEAIPNGKVHKILRISYDSLEDDHDRNLFLDIAVCSLGKTDYTTTILDGCDFYTTIGIENLIRRSLLTINEKNKLMMHQMIRDMGREIIRQESSDVGERSRLWAQGRIRCNKRKTGSRTIKCLALDLQGLLENKSKKTATTLHLPKHGMETEAFEKMQRLQLLQLDHVKLKGDFKDFPKSLIWLRWHGFPMQSLPADFDIRRLVALDMRYSNLKRVWKDKECVPNLKILNLNHSHGLLKTPNFSGPSLEKLMLKDCIKLVEVDESIGELKMLTFLNLKDCKSLGKLPRTIGSLVSLEELILSGCSTLDNKLQMIPKLPIFSNSKEAFMTKSPFNQSIIPSFFPVQRMCGAIENFGEEEIERLFNVDSINKSRVQLYNFLIDRTRVATPQQVLQECGITSTFVAEVKFRLDSSISAMSIKSHFLYQKKTYIGQLMHRLLHH